MQIQPNSTKIQLDRIDLYNLLDGVLLNTKNRNDKLRDLEMRKLGRYSIVTGFFNWDDNILDGLTLIELLELYKSLK